MTAEHRGGRTLLTQQSSFVPRQVTTARVTFTAKLAYQVGAVLVGVAALDPAPPVAAPAAGAVSSILLPVQEKEIRVDLKAAKQQSSGLDRGLIKAAPFIELVHHRTSANREQAGRDLTAYMHGFYNRQRRQAALGYRTPTKAEQSAAGIALSIPNATRLRRHRTCVGSDRAVC